MAHSCRGAAALLLISTCVALSAPAGEAGWKMLAGGLAYRTLTSSKKCQGPPFVLGLVRADLEKVKLRILDARHFGQEALSVDQFAKKSKMPVVVNGGFFLPDRSPLGLVISDGVTLNPLRRADWGVFYISHGRPRIVHTRDFKTNDAISQAIQSGPRLVADGRPFKLKHQTARRTAIAIDAKGRILLLFTLVGSPLASDLADILRRQEPEGAGARFALNLDGGPSAQAYVETGGMHLRLDGGWPVPTAVALAPRETTNTR